MEISGSNPLPPATTQGPAAQQQPRESAELASPPDTSATPAQAQAAQAPDPSARIGGQIDTFV